MARTAGQCNQQNIELIHRFDRIHPYSIPRTTIKYD
nr:MAG TPA: hypothetical protein [Caudoviricetes sp.]